MKPSQFSERSQRVRVGVEYGLAMAVVLIAWAGVAFLFIGPHSPEDDFPYSFSSIALLYLFGGVSGGALGGLLWPMTRTRPGAYVVGAVSIMPFGLMFVVPVVWMEAQDALETLWVSLFATVFTSIFLGGTCGLTIFYPKGRSRSDE